MIEFKSGTDEYGDEGQREYLDCYNRDKFLYRLWENECQSIYDYETLLGYIYEQGFVDGYNSLINQGKVKVKLHLNSASLVCLQVGKRFFHFGVRKDFRCWGRSYEHSPVLDVVGFGPFFQIVTKLT